MTSGFWGDSVEQGTLTAVKGKKTHNLTSKLTVGLDGNMKINNTTKTEGGSVSGYWGAISKTEDGGVTWEIVFHSEPDDLYYFNAISCSSDKHCVAVAEGMFV